MKKELLQGAFDALPAPFKEATPTCGMILGSGWSNAISALPDREEADYADIPGLGAAGVEGHAGKLILGEIHGIQIIAFCGRRHWYEGVGWSPVAIPVDICRRLKVGCLLITNAAGGIRPGLHPGDLMILRDHINSVGLSPLQGPHDPDWGPRFPDQSSVYDPALRDIVRKAGHDANIPLLDGIYAFTAGPTYETPAEVRALGVQGADAVGMSTVPETMLANAAGLRICAISCITNMAAGIAGPHLSHAEVLEQTRETTPRMKALLNAFLKRLSGND